MSDPIFPPPTLPTIFADGVANFFHSPEVGKFYLMRIDPELGGGPRSSQQIVAQVAMPMAGFVLSAAFFAKAIERLLEQGAVTQEQWKAAQVTQSGFEFKK
jgi:hypothetical protein